MSRPFLLLVATLLAPGCYLDHERPCVAVAAARSVAPDPVVAPGDVAFELDGAARVVSDSIEHGTFADLRLVSTGDGWGATWSFELRLLDADGARIDSPRHPRSLGTAFGDDRFAVVLPLRTDSHVSFLDRAMARAGPEGTYGPADASAVAWLASRNAWVVVSNVAHRVEVAVIGADGSAQEHFTLASAPTTDVVLQLAATQERVLVMWQSDATVLGGALLGGASLHDEMPSALLARDHGGAGAPSVAAYREWFLVAGADGAHMRVGSVDATECGPTVATPVVVGDTTIIDRRPGIAVAPDRGFYVVCFVDAPGVSATVSSGAASIVLQAMGEDDRPWGAPFALASDVDFVGSIDCGWNGHDVVVLWSDVTAGNVVTQRAHPTFL